MTAFQFNHNHLTRAKCSKQKISRHHRAPRISRWSSASWPPNLSSSTTDPPTYSCLLIPPRSRPPRRIWPTSTSPCSLYGGTCPCWRICSRTSLISQKSLIQTATKKFYRSRPPQTCLQGSSGPQTKNKAKALNQRKTSLHEASSVYLTVLPCIIKIHWSAPRQAVSSCRAVQTSRPGGVRTCWSRARIISTSATHLCCLANTQTKCPNSRRSD